jgi:uncharacterized membrane protein
MSIPPLHAIAVHVPVTLVPLALVADWIGLRRDWPRVHDFGLWCLLLGWIGTGAAIALGYIDLSRVLRNPATHAHYPYLLLHAKLAWLVLPVVTAQLFWRWQISLGRNRRYGLYLATATAGVALMLFEAWYGGELVYTAGIGAAPDQSVTNAAEAQQTFDTVHHAVTRVPGLSTHPLPDVAPETPAH